MKIKFTLLLFLILLFGEMSLYAQSQRTFREHGWYLRTSINPSAGFLVTQNSTSNSFLAQLTPTIAGSFGSMVGFPLNTKFSIEGGISITRRGYRAKYQGLVFADQIMPSPGTINPVTVLIRNSFNYFCIPIKVRASEGEKRAKLAYSAGFQLEYLLNQKTISLYDYQTHVSTETKSISPDTDRFNIAPNMGIGVEFDVNTKNALSLMSEASFGLVNIKDFGGSHLYNIGLEVSWIYRI